MNLATLHNLIKLKEIELQSLTMVFNRSRLIKVCNQSYGLARHSIDTTTKELKQLKLKLNLTR